MKRNEFSQKVQNEIVDRSKDSSGQICCEGCGLVLGGKPYDIDHTVPDALRDPNEKPKKLTAEDGKLLGHCCHKPKTAKDIAQISKAKRQRSKANRTKKPNKRPIQSRNDLKVEKHTKIDKSKITNLGQPGIYRQFKSK